MRIRPIPTVTGLLLALLLVQTSLLIHKLEHANHAPDNPCEICVLSSNLEDIGTAARIDSSIAVCCDNVISLPCSSNSADLAAPCARGPPA